MTEKEPGSISGKRLYFLDNLRTFMIFCVVIYHAGGVYESGGFWASFWLVDDPSTNDLCGILNIIIDVFVMPTIFFISGYLTPLSLKNRNGLAFIKSKFKRLMVPWLIAVLVLIPLYKIIFLYSRNLPQESWTTYFHWTNGIWSMNWLWFLPVLFIFQLVYLAFSKTKLNLSNIPLKAAVSAVFIICYLYSFLMGMYKLEGWTYAILFDFQNERVLIYFMYFLLGALCFTKGIFDSEPGSKKLYIAVSCTVWMPINLYIILLLNFILKPGQFIFSGWTDGILFWLGFHLSLLCLLYLFVATFRYWINRQGKILKILNTSSYGAYIIHVIVIGVIALALLNAPIPSIAKYLTLIISTWIACNVIVYLYKTLFSSIR